jgi:uncharacterized membrane protein YeaQ/YmgE (transglycosylase-associated protein family)
MLGVTTRRSAPNVAPARDAKARRCKITVLTALLIAILLLIAFLIVVQSIVGLILAGLVALAAGYIAEGVAGRRNGGILMTLLLGFIGAVVGTLIARVLDLPVFVRIGGLPVVWTVVGAILVAILWQAFGEERRSY